MGTTSEPADARQRRVEAAARALAEAELRRPAAGPSGPEALPKEMGGRGGPDPVRYGDWEVKGRAVDF